MGSCIAQRLTTHKLSFFNDFGKGDKSQEDDLNRNILEVSRIKNLKHQTLKQVLSNVSSCYFFNSFPLGFRKNLLK